MTILKLALKNLLGAGLRTWLNVFVLSLSFVLIIFSQGLLEGHEQAGRGGHDRLRDRRRPLPAPGLRPVRPADPHRRPRPRPGAPRGPGRVRQGRAGPRRPGHDLSRRPAVHGPRQGHRSGPDRGQPPDVRRSPPRSPATRSPSSSASAWPR
ncbi:MAG: hypothetical protein MZU79_06145 [Anaerotruncus sp.]|nr:hypothetical protein [Anaerotruncus sp.]